LVRHLDAQEIRDIFNVRAALDKPPARTVDTADLLAKVGQGRRLVVLDDDPDRHPERLRAAGADELVGRRPAVGAAPRHNRLLRPHPHPQLVRNRHRRTQSADRAGTVAAARQEGVDFSIASRSDSTLRGYFPLETDVLARELASFDIHIDGVIIVPALIEPGRVTIDSVHWMRTTVGMIPVSHSEFAKDASFGYLQSDLRDWVQEKTAGRITRDQVATITLGDLRATAARTLCLTS
jgi:hypothetical protein